MNVSLKNAARAVVVAGTLAFTSCSPPQQQIVAAPSAPAPEVGRYQIVQTAQALILLDSKEGRTWVYRTPIVTPVGNAYNGFWTDVPRFEGVQYPTQIMQAILHVLTQQAGGALVGTNAPAARLTTPSTTTPSTP